MKKNFALLLIGYLFNTGAANYSGITDSGEHCYMKEDLEYQTVSFSIKGGNIYKLRKKADMSYRSTTLISAGNGLYREPIGAIITIFGLGTKKVILNLTKKEGLPTSYHLSVSGFSNNIQCNDLKKSSDI